MVDLSPQISVLGSLLIEPDLIGPAMQELKAEDFTATPCRMVWQAMASLFCAGQTVDPVTVRAKLEGFENATSFLVQLMDSTPSAANFESYVKLLKKEAALERLRQLGAAMQQAVNLDDAMDALAKANEASVQRSGLKRYNARQMLELFAARHSSDISPEYIPWPIDKLNGRVSAQPGDYIIIGGYPSDGKTAFSLLCAWCQSRKYRVGYYSLETNAEKIADRSMAAIAKINLANIKKNMVTDEEWSRYAIAAGQIADWPIDVIPAAGCTVDDIRADALANRYQVIYIDYLQLIIPGKSRIGSRYDEVSAISRNLHQLSQSTGITVVALSQMTRPAAKADGTFPEPTMHNLRESGQIEQDADVIMLLYRVNQNDIKSQRKLSVAKNKEGTTGRLTLDFDGEYQRFIPTGARRPRHPLGIDLPEQATQQEEFAIINEPDDNNPF